MRSGIWKYVKDLRSILHGLGTKTIKQPSNYKSQEIITDSAIFTVRKLDLIWKL